MILKILASCVKQVGIPRESGDDPTQIADNNYSLAYSPRERG